MAELRFKVKADITKVSELRKEIERLEGALRRMSKSADGAAFEKVVEKLSSTRKELQGMVKNIRGCISAPPFLSFSARRPPTL